MEYKKGKKITDRFQFVKGQKYFNDDEVFEFSHLGKDRDPCFVYYGRFYDTSDDEYNCAPFTFERHDFYEAVEVKQKLPETGLLVSKSGVFMMRTGKKSGYGFFTSGTFTSGGAWSFESYPHQWRPATKEDEERWKELLIEEAKRRGYVKGASVKSLNGKRVQKIEGIFFMNRLNELCSNDLNSKTIGEIIFQNGEWAEIIEEVKPESNCKIFTDLLTKSYQNRKQPKTVDEVEIEFAINKLTELAKSKNININITIKNK